MARVYDIIYTTALVISIEGDINDNGFDPVQSPHDGYELGIGRPSRAFPPTPPAIRVRSKAVRFS